MTMKKTTVNSKILTILICLLTLLPSAAKAQVGFDAVSIEAYIKDHKQQRSLLLVRSTLEASNKLLHDYSGDANIGFRDINKELDKYTRAFDVIDILYQSLRTSLNVYSTYENVSDKVGDYRKMLNDFRKKCLERGNIMSTDTLIITINTKALAKIADEGDNLYRSVSDLLLYATGAAACSTSDLLLIITSINNSLDNMSDTIGGWCWYDESFDEKTGVLDTPRYVDQGNVTRQLFDNVDLAGEVQTKILEINSKTGLYPLYVTYSLFRRRLDEYIKAECIDKETVSVQEEQVVWDDIVKDNMYVICNTPMAVGITRRTLFGFRQVDQKANIKNVQLIEQASHDQEGLISEMLSIGFWKGNSSKQKMKFNAVVGNPPYQVSLSEISSYAGSIYPLFIDLARKLKPSYISMITPSRWMTKDGQGVKDEWVDEMINCNHFIKIYDYLNASECFPGVEIKGGVNYFLYSGTYLGSCNHYITHGGHTEMKNGKLNALNAGIIIRDSYAKNILEKIIKVEGQLTYESSFSKLISPRDFFTTKINGESILGSNWKGYVEVKDSCHPIKFYLNKQLTSTGYGWINENDIPKNKQAKSIHKVYISKAYGAGENFPHQIIGVPFYGEPESVCSVTYIVIGYNGEFPSKEVCDNVISYIKTKFFRYLVLIKKKTQNVTRELFQFVPMQDFSKSWTDEELYTKYNIDLFEREYIESLIKPMD